MKGGDLLMAATIHAETHTHTHTHQNQRTKQKKEDKDNQRKATETRRKKRRPQSRSLNCRLPRFHSVTTFFFSTRWEKSTASFFSCCLLFFYRVFLPVFVSVFILIDFKATTKRASFFFFSFTAILLNQCPVKLNKTR